MDATQLKDILAQHAFKVQTEFALKKKAEGLSPYFPRKPENSYQELLVEIDGYFTDKPEKVEASVVTVEMVDYELGGEDKFLNGEGEIYIVLKVVTDGREQYFRLDGTYASFDGTRWNDEWKEVKPTEKVVIVYE